MQRMNSTLICDNNRALMDGQALAVCVHLDVDALWPAMNGIANAVIQCLTSSKVTS